MRMGAISLRALDDPELDGLHLKILALVGNLDQKGRIELDPHELAERWSVAAEEVSDAVSTLLALDYIRVDFSDPEGSFRPILDPVGRYPTYRDAAIGRQREEDYVNPAMIAETSRRREAKALAKLGVGADVLSEIFDMPWGRARELELNAKRDVIPLAVRRYVMWRDGFKCCECGTRKNLTLDHVWPVAKGGPCLEYNLRTLCKSCNSRKRDRTCEVQG